MWAFPTILWSCVSGVYNLTPCGAVFSFSEWVMTTKCKATLSSIQNHTYTLSCWGSLRIFGNSSRHEPRGNKTEGPRKQCCIQSHSKKHQQINCASKQNQAIMQILVIMSLRAYTTLFFFPVELWLYVYTRQWLHWFISPLISNVVFIKGLVYCVNSAPPVSSVSLYPAVAYFYHPQTWKYCMAVGREFGWDKFVCSSLPLGSPGEAHYSPFSYQSSEGHFGHQNSLFVCVFTNRVSACRSDQAAEQLSHRGSRGGGI